MDHIGIDVHKRESQIYILAEGGEIIERRIRTEPARFAAVLGDRPRARMLIEASTDSEWVARSSRASSPAWPPPRLLKRAGPRLGAPGSHPRPYKTTQAHFAQIDIKRADMREGEGCRRVTPERG